jgi:hypothetical protein
MEKGSVRTMEATFTIPLIRSKEVPDSSLHHWAFLGRNGGECVDAIVSIVNLENMTRSPMYYSTMSQMSVLTLRSLVVRKECQLPVDIFFTVKPKNCAVITAHTWAQSSTNKVTPNLLPVHSEANKHVRI